MNEVTILAPNEVVEQLEASERLPQDIDPDTLRKYFTLTRPISSRSISAEVWPISWVLPSSSARCAGAATSYETREKFQSRFWRPCPYNSVSYQSRLTTTRKTKKRDLIIWNGFVST